MTTPATPSAPKPAGSTKPAAEGETPVVAPFDEQLHGFWKNNRQAIFVLCGILLVFYVGKMGWEAYVDQREASIQADFAAATTPGKLEAFVAAHPDHGLAGVAQLGLADDAYAQQHTIAAVDGYARALVMLKTGPLAARARLGLAMSKVQAGQTADGESLLRELAGDFKQFKAVRAEATYQLASLAASAGRADDVQKLALQVMQIDPNSPWAQRAFALQARLPAGPAPVPPASAQPNVRFQSKGP